MRRNAWVWASIFVCCVVLVACDTSQEKPGSQDKDSDKSNPELTLEGETERVVANSSVRLEGKVSEDTITLLYRLNGGKPQNALVTVTKGTFELVIEGLQAGDNTIILEATDAAGNTTVSEVVTVFVMDVRGVWGSITAPFRFCDFSDEASVLVVKLEPTDSSVINGTVTTGFGGDYRLGTLTGQFTTNNVIEGSVVFPAGASNSQEALGTLRLTINKDSLSAELEYQDGQSCSENDTALASTFVSGFLVKDVDVPPLPPDDALEPNDTLATATTISLPYQKNAITLRGNDDWFRFDIRKSSLITLSLSTSQTQGSFGLQLYNAKGPIGEARFASDPFPFETTWGVEAGTYYLEVIGDPYYKVADLPYAISLSAKATPDAQFEPNNRAAEAAQISLPFQEELYLEEGDEDWFKFTLSKESQLSFGEITTGSSLYNAQLEQIATEQDFYFPMTLAAGTYYLRVEELGGATSYSVSMSADSSNLTLSIQTLSP
ncbi:MAG: hypothetical protein ACRCYY_18530 [Trueperaceae bacterium]